VSSVAKDLLDCDLISVSRSQDSEFFLCLSTHVKRLYVFDGVFLHLPCREFL
jgi:hypothetical protein